MFVRACVCTHSLVSSRSKSKASGGKSLIANSLAYLVVKVDCKLIPSKRLSYIRYIYPSFSPVRWSLSKVRNRPCWKTLSKRPALKVGGERRRRKRERKKERGGKRQRVLEPTMLSAYSFERITFSTFPTASVWCVVIFLNSGFQIIIVSNKPQGEKK